MKDGGKTWRKSIADERKISYNKWQEKYRQGKDSLKLAGHKERASWGWMEGSTWPGGRTHRWRAGEETEADMPWCCQGSLSLPFLVLPKKGGTTQQRETENMEHREPAHSQLVQRSWVLGVKTYRIWRRTQTTWKSLLYVSENQKSKELRARHLLGKENRMES
jgi:hypothetical protein